MDRYLEPRIAAELRAELARQGHSRHWLADQIGKPVTTVARWLRGPQSPGLNDLDAMCQALGMTIADLLSAVERNGGYQPLVTSDGRSAGGSGHGRRATDISQAPGGNTDELLASTLAA